MKAVLKAIAFITIMLAITFVVFVMWLPRSDMGTVEEFEYTIINSGEKVTVQSTKYYPTEKKEDWIVAKAREHPAELKVEYGVSFNIKFDKNPKHLKLLLAIEGSGAYPSIIGIPKGAPNPANVNEFCISYLDKGEHIIELWINSNGQIEKIAVDGEVYTPCGKATFGIATFGKIFEYWVLSIDFTNENSEFTVKTKILEKQ